MTAAKLSEILLKNPDAIVMIEEYNGGYSPLSEIKNTSFKKAGKPFQNEGGDFIKGKENGVPVKNLIILSTCENG